MAKVDREEMARRKTAFALAWATPGTQKYRNGPESYRAALGEDEPLTADAARQGASRYLADPDVQAEIARVQEAGERRAGLSIDTFVLECLENEERMLQKLEENGGGGKGAATAAVKYRELAGEALGYLGQQAKGKSAEQPEEQPAVRPPRSREELMKMRQAIDTLLEVSEPMPLPPGEMEVVDAEDES